MDSIVTKAYAKINISLDVVGKRADGYHLLKMIMQTIDLYDVVKVKKINNGIILNSDKSYIPTDARNTAYKAAKMFLDKYNINCGVNINIQKNIPVSAGLAGGSTDAAAVLRCMRKLFNINLNYYDLRKLGLSIGADVPYCISGGTALCEGIGEIITPLSRFNNKIIVLVKPNFGVSTKEIYKNLKLEKIHKHPNTEKLLEHIKKDKLIYLSKDMQNVLENVTIQMNPIIKKIKQDMIKLGALGSMMSGSGPSVFGFFNDMFTAQKCYDKFKKEYNEVFITRTI